MPQLLRPEQAAEETNLPRTTIYRLIRSGALESLKIGRRRLIPADAVRKFIERNRQEQAGVSGGAR